MAGQTDTDKGYVEIDQLKKFVSDTRSKFPDSFGGVMLWDAGLAKSEYDSSQCVICLGLKSVANHNYDQQIKDFLAGGSGGAPSSGSGGSGSSTHYEPSETSTGTAGGETPPPSSSADPTVTGPSSDPTETETETATPTCDPTPPISTSVDPTATDPSVTSAPTETETETETGTAASPSGTDAHGARTLMPLIPNYTNVCHRTRFGFRR